jgi:hypothetical protein
MGLGNPKWEYLPTIKTVKTVAHRSMRLGTNGVPFERWRLFVA